MKDNDREKRNDEWLTGNDTEVEGTKALSEMLKKNSTLKSLNLWSEE